MSKKKKNRQASGIEELAREANPDLTEENQENAPEEEQADTPEIAGEQVSEENAAPAEQGDPVGDVEPEESVELIEAPDPVNNKEKLMLDDEQAEKPVVEQPQPPKAVAVQAAPPSTRKPIMANELLPSGNAIQRRMKILPTHTAAGEKLIKMIDEYAEMCKIRTDDVKILKDRLAKLGAIVNAACPPGISSVPLDVARDLVKIMFDKVTQYRQTVFNERNLFKVDYKLAAGPAAIDRLEGFLQAMLQLSDAANTGSKIRFDERALGVVVKQRNIIAAISALHKSIDERNGIGAGSL